jgi:hypothetical protein
MANCGTIFRYSLYLHFPRHITYLEQDQRKYKRIVSLLYMGRSMLEKSNACFLKRLFSKMFNLVILAIFSLSS